MSLLATRRALGNVVRSRTNCTLELVAAADSDDPRASSAHLVCTADRQPLCK